MKIKIRHQGRTLAVYRSSTRRNGTNYVSFQVPDYSSGRRRLLTFNNLPDARAKAKQLADGCQAGQYSLLALGSRESEILAALKLAEPLGLTLSRMAAIVVDAVKFVGVEDIVAACRAYRDLRPGKVIPRKVAEVVPEFLGRRKSKISLRRHKSETSFLKAFSDKFGERLAHEITTLEIKDWSDAKAWCPKTKNEILGVIRMLYGEAIERHHATVNPALIKREKVIGGDVPIFAPADVRKILVAMEDSLKPFFAMMFFSGGRKEELSRLTAAQVREGLRSGSIFMKASSTKTGRSRGITVCPNLRVWLERYLPANGNLLPERWCSQARLDVLQVHAEQQSGVKWLRNAARHSFGTYHLKLHGDAAETVKQLGNSLPQLDRHYSSRADSVTKESAAEYFSIVPTKSAKVLPIKAAPAAAQEPPQLIAAKA